MARTWVAVVNQSNARFFSRSPFLLTVHLENELGRERNRNMQYDQAGTSRAKMIGANPYGLGAEKDPHEDAAVDFAKEVTNQLNQKFLQKRFDELLIIAGPKTTGRLKQSLHKDLLPVTEWMSKDLGNLSEHEIAKYLGIETRISS